MLTKATYWPKQRYLELAPKYWLATRAKLNPDELNAPLCSFTIPASQQLSQAGRYKIAEPSSTWVPCIATE